MKHVNQIGIIGAGELGSALGKVLTKAGAQILYYDTRPELSTTGSIEDIVRSCQVMLLCVPSWSVKSVLKNILKAAQPHEPRLIVSLAKGVEKGFVTMETILQQNLPHYYDSGVLYGPMIAEEIARGRSSAGVLALTNNAWFTALQPIFADANVVLERSGDARGVSLCAAYKNIYAIAFGIADGSRLGVNAKGMLATKVLAEMKRLLADMGGHPLTAEGMAGLGDLLATGFSEESFNFRIGKSLAEGIADEHIKSEGLVALHELSRATELKKYPVAHTISQIVFHYGKPTQLAELIAA